MRPTPTDPSTVPAPPPFATSTEIDPSCEEDVDLDDVDQPDEDDDEYCPLFGEHEQDLIRAETQEEEVEFMGEAESLEEYFRSQLEPFIDSCIQSWLFDALDMDEVQRQFEGNGKYRFILEGRGVYRAGLPLKPSRDKDDSPGPWMPTRGG